MGLVHSTDNGVSWSDFSFAELNEDDNHNPVDPSIYQLDDGTLLLIYQDLN